MKLKDIRLKKGFTQEKLAKKLNIVRTTVSSWEIGKTEPDLKNLIALSKILDVSVDELLGINIIKYDDLTDIELKIINLCRTMSISKVKEGFNYLEYLSNKK